jgi:hypothetical protein
LIDRMYFFRRVGRSAAYHLSGRSVAQRLHSYDYKITKRDTTQLMD